MSKRAFDKIAAGLEDAVAYAGGDTSRGETRIDAFSQHEVLHAAHIITSMFDDFISEHVAVKADAEMTEAAERISRSLADFYQLCGRKFV